MGPEDLLELRNDLRRERQRLERLQKYLRFRHLVRNLYSDDLRQEPIQLLLRDLPEVWQGLARDPVHFEVWAASVAREGK